MRTIFIAIIFFSPLALLAQKPECNCKDFYTGTFYLITSEEDKDTCFIYRTASGQREVVPNDDIEEEFTVTWLDECTYLLRPKGIKSKKKKIKGVDVIATIVETTENSYTVKAKSVGGKSMYFTIRRYEP